MRYINLILILLILTSCGYPDIDDVPNFNDVNLTQQEIRDYCKNTNSIKKNIDKCINDYINKKNYEKN